MHLDRRYQEMMHGAPKPWHNQTQTQTLDPISTGRAFERAQAPVTLPVAPVAAMRCAASASVEHVMDCKPPMSDSEQKQGKNKNKKQKTKRKSEIVLTVPALFTSGSAKHCAPPAHDVVTNFPPTHCANAPPTHACAPSWHGEAAVRVANCAFSACASSPFSKRGKGGSGQRVWPWTR